MNRRYKNRNMMYNNRRMMFGSKLLITVALVAIGLVTLVYDFLTKDITLGNPLLSSFYYLHYKHVKSFVFNQTQHSFINGSLVPVSVSQNLREQYCKFEKFLVFYCGSSDRCGGIADRQRGIISVYLLSLLLKRTFAIVAIKPCPLSNFLEPNIYDWRFCKEYFGTPEELENHMDEGNEKFRDKIPKLFLNHDFKHRITYTLTNWAWIEGIRRHRDAPDLIPWMTNMTNNEVYAEVLKRLFKPTKRLQNDLQIFFSSVTNNHKVICAHIRMYKNPSVPDDEDRRSPNATSILNFLKIESSFGAYKIFVASDSEEVKDKARQMFSQQNVILSRTIIHVDRFSEEENDVACEGLYTSLLEQIILSKCDKLVITNSGFGVNAAYMRNSSENLFCFCNEINAVIPCSLTFVLNNFVLLH